MFGAAAVIGAVFQLLHHLGDQAGQTGEIIGSSSEDDCLYSTPAVISEILFHSTTQAGYCSVSVIFVSVGARAVNSSHRAYSLFLSELKEHTLPVTVCQAYPSKTSKLKIFS